MTHTLYTIGYAGKDIDTFIKLLKKHGIKCLIDVRSSPFSGTFPEYDKPRLKETLATNDILYAHFGSEFGARRTEDEAYSVTYSLKGERKDQVDFQKVYQLPAFQKGVERIIKGAEQNYSICFMCSEKHPIDCHRFWMVAYYFATLSLSFDIINIISENETQSFKDVLDSVDIDKEKKKFYSEHDELNECSLVPVQVPLWVRYWNEIFSNGENNKEQKSSNIRIGYVKGSEEEYD